MIRFTNKDIKQAMTIKPGYYRVRLNKLSEAISKKGNSRNYVIDEAEILADEMGNTEFTGVPIGKPWWGFNDQRMDLLIPFVEAVKGDKIVDGDGLEWKGLEGREVLVMIANEVKEGRTVNVIQQMYKPLPK